jgi:hypothetical protein
MENQQTGGTGSCDLPCIGANGKLQECLSFLENGSVGTRNAGIRSKFGFDSEFPSVQKLRLMVETNTREHFNATLR